VPVLLYHGISGGSGSLFITSPRRFGEHIRANADAGRTGLSAAAFARCLQEHDPWPERPIVVTIDDGHDDSVEAIERLAACGVPTTIYIATGMIGEPGRLDVAAIRHLAAMPLVEIGAHSVHHIELEALPRHVAEREISESRAVLEQLIQQPVGSFAYPFGAYDPAIREMVIAAGYGSAAAVKGALSRPGDDPFSFARLAMLSTTTGRELSFWMDGEVAPIVAGGDPWWKPAERSLRRVRRRVQAV
jgi:peptidoglycan/xylan/chitin deacetylase (PgdA/CDA1 family)